MSIFFRKRDLVQPVSHSVTVPPLRTMFARIGMQVMEGTVVPSMIFWSILHVGGLVAGLLSALGWCYLAVVRRWAKGTALPAVLVLAALLFTTRTGIALAYHSTFMYLLTPTLNAFVLATAFAGSALLGRPLTARFARDFVGLPPAVTALPKVQQALQRLCGVWALASVINGAVSLDLLLARHYDSVMLARSVLTPVLTAGAVACCVIMGRRAMHEEGIHVHVRWRDPVVGDTR